MALAYLAFPVVVGAPISSRAQPKVLQIVAALVLFTAAVMAGALAGEMAWALLISRLVPRADAERAVRRHTNRAGDLLYFLRWAYKRRRSVLR